MIDHSLTSILKSENLTKFTKELSEEEKRDVHLLSEKAKEKKLTILINENNEDEMINLDLLRKNWLNIYLDGDKTTLFFSERERQLGLFLLLFTDEELVSVSLLMEMFFVSKNTVLSDIKKLKDLLLKNKIEIKNTRKKGYYLYGDEETIRSLCYEFIGELITEKKGYQLIYSLIWQVSNYHYHDVKEILFKTIDEHHLILFPSKKDYLTYFFSLLTIRMKYKTVSLSEEDKKFIQTIYTHNLSSNFLNHFEDIKNSENEIIYISIVFLSIVQGKEDDLKFGFLIACADLIIKDTERRAAIEFVHYRQLLVSLYTHLVPAYFRIKYKLPIKNDLIDKIKKQHNDLFVIVKKSLKHLEEITNMPIPESEIGYVTILFGAAISNQKESNEVGSYQGLIVCPSGISSSLMLKSELEQLFPLIKFDSTDSISLKQTINLDQYDIIFSNVDLNVSEKIYKVHPVMSKVEKVSLLQKVQMELFSDAPMYPNAENIISMILPHVTLKDGMNVEKLNQIVSQKIENKISRKDGEKPMLSELLTKDMIQFSNEKMNWEQAIELSAQPLLSNKKIRETYIEAMVNKVKEFGAFINIGKNIALPHARPEDGVNELGMSLLKLKEPVFLLDDEKHPVTVFICLAASDNASHLKALASLTKILSNKELFEELLASDSTEEIIKIINKGE